MSKTDKTTGLRITINRHIPAIIEVNGSLIELYFDKNHGTYKSSVRIVCEKECKIYGPHIVKKIRDALAAEKVQDGTVVS